MAQHELLFLELYKRYEAGFVWVMLLHIRALQQAKKGDFLLFEIIVHRTFNEWSYSMHL